MSMHEPRDAGRSQLAPCAIHARFGRDPPKTCRGAICFRAIPATGSAPSQDATSRMAAGPATIYITLIYGDMAIHRKTWCTVRRRRQGDGQYSDLH